jgi:hypothetical protein
MKNRTRRAAGLLAVAALAFPALAAAEQGERPGHEQAGERPGHEQAGERRSEKRAKKARPWNVQGEVVAKGEDTVTLKIRRSSRLPRAMRGQEVTFDMSEARILVRDVNGDGEQNLDDVSVGDRGHVKARLPRRQALQSGQAVPARLGIFRAPRPKAEEPEETTPESTS